MLVPFFFARGCNKWPWFKTNATMFFSIFFSVHHDILEPILVVGLNRMFTKGCDFWVFGRMAMACGWSPSIPGAELGSRPLGRVSTGALVEQLGTEGARLHYRRDRLRPSEDGCFTFLGKCFVFVCWFCSFLVGVCKKQAAVCQAIPRVVKLGVSF